MSETIIKADNNSKVFRLASVGLSALRRVIRRRWVKILPESRMLFFTLIKKLIVQLHVYGRCIMLVLKLNSLSCLFQK